MKPKGSGSSDTPDWKEAADEVLDRAKEVARRAAERVKKLAEDTAPGPALKPDEPTGEAPPAG